MSEEFVERVFEPYPGAFDEILGPYPDFQTGVAKWMMACFGPEIAADRLERADRFTEEALELAQTMPGFTADRAHALVDYVFGRPVGERGQEVGGVMVTLAALCNSFALSIEGEADRELARVWTKVEQIRAKQASKPKGSALPMEVAAESLGLSASPSAIGHEDGSTTGYPAARSRLATANTALRYALAKCKDQFAFYAREHEAAGKHEKAATNRHFSDLAEAALGLARVGGQDDV